MALRLVLKRPRQYRRTAHLNTTHRRRQAFYALPSAHWQMLAEPPFSILDHLTRVDDAIDANADIADAILATGLASFGLPADPSPDDPARNWHDTATSSDVNKAHSTIRQFYRDWSDEGAWEQEICYSPVFWALDGEFRDQHAPGQDQNEEIKVLVPGAGLGRLVFKLCLRGFAAEGNEISYHQLMASNWVLNQTAGAKQHALYPFAHHFSNLRSREQQLRKVLIPDMQPGRVIMDSDFRYGTMSMSAADFAVAYRSESNREAFHAVATVFFIDTAPNLIRYVEAIRNCLKPNGIWINVGPLLWHFEEGKNHQESHSEGIGESGSVELTEQEVFCLAERMGFDIEKRPLEDSREQPEERRCGYIQDPESMLQNLYRPSYWIARKK